MPLESLFFLARAFNSLYADPDHHIKTLTGPRRDGLLLLIKAVASVLERGCALLGISLVDVM